ncbi:MAG: tRNA adenosine(34) deaminase TadA [Nitrospirae bacterium]|nr:tRNA adenosine(34) deaminase TadA [Nitrospirota bacterium]MBI3605740.1 tRNA adenosine(34) deaminase TadA [Nitrospirota bacterium]
MNVQDHFYMQLALEEARAAYVKGEVPVGAILVAGNQVIARAHNLRESQNDPTAHAEMVVIREASRLLNKWRLSDATLYVTLEPCVMCAGALVHARIPRLVFGCFDPKAGACGSLMNIPHDNQLNHRIEMDSGCLEQECSHILQQFFSELRIQKKTVLSCH